MEEQELDIEEFNIWKSERGHMKALAKANARISQGGTHADGFQEFPKMLYRAKKHPFGGKFYVSLDEDELSPDRTRVLVDAQAFNRQCQMTVEDAEKEARAREDGWRPSQAEAVQYRLDEDKREAHEAAARNHADRNMSEKALTEAKRVEEATPTHMGEIPQTPVKHRGRPKGSKNKTKTQPGV
jgi:hypothetical protein